MNKYGTDGVSAKITMTSIQQFLAGRNYAKQGESVTLSSNWQVNHQEWSMILQCLADQGKELREVFLQMVVPRPFLNPTETLLVIQFRIHNLRAGLRSFTPWYMDEWVWHMDKEPGAEYDIDIANEIERASLSFLLQEPPDKNRDEFISLTKYWRKFK